MVFIIIKNCWLLGTHAGECLYAEVIHGQPIFLCYRQSQARWYYLTMLFNLYIDDFSLTLNCSGIGGYIRVSLINHLCYADDLCLISGICNSY